ncbi:MAG: ribose 5-phosphate isomerase B [Candidatus Acididesulfobacter guangdongensis]|uniref:Ribose 5-phosphate isomerase B n=1 Tax=Acididesulfobacter guangdongensis TaxID=2597225 RepID=A0A519BIJ6_ACIG2|nr:MAG: ribose 5-phosphate isomerase B [Candidatus Acididesulfobacter guangdongensis]
MKVYIGSDHAGFDLKESIKNYLKEKKIEFIDLGTDSATRSVDYPDYAKKVAEETAKDSGSIGILACGTGIGMSIAANKVKGIRAALIYDEYTAVVAKKHNNANVITFGGRTMTPLEVERYLDNFLNTEFEGGRHQHRIDEINNI